MNVYRVAPSGYCKGVVRAIVMAKKTRKAYPDKTIYVAGPIVHNHYVSRGLAEIGIITLDKTHRKEEWLDILEPGVIIFSAHGIAEEIKKKAIHKGFIVVDASCEDVIRTQEIIKKRLAENYEVLYIGKKNHPEAEAVLALSDKIHLITEMKDVLSLSLPRDNAYFVTNQTTMSMFEIRDVFQTIKDCFPQAIFEKELCHATTSRQEAILALTNCDLLYVVGDPGSNNSNKLAEIAKESGIPQVRMIETAAEIEECDLQHAQNVYVTAGASTPTYLSNQVLAILKKYAAEGILEKPSIDFQKIL